MSRQYWEDFETGIKFKTSKVTVTETHLVMKCTGKDQTGSLVKVMREIRFGG